MLVRNGWAAFLVLVTILGYSETARASGRPIIACFSPQNANLIGRLGPDDGSVRHAFDLGACLAFSPGAPVSDVARDGNIWRFRVFGARSMLFAQDWGAGFADQSPNDARIEMFARFISTTAGILREGRSFVDCYDAYADYSTRWNSFNRRVTDYEAVRQRSGTDPMTSTRIYFAKTGPALRAESEALRAEGDRLHNRCNRALAMELDEEFIDFMRTVNRV